MGREGRHTHLLIELVFVLCMEVNGHFLCADVLGAKLAYGVGVVVPPVLETIAEEGDEDTGQETDNEYR